MTEPTSDASSHEGARPQYSQAERIVNIVMQHVNCACSCVTHRECWNNQVKDVENELAVPVLSPLQETTDPMTITSDDLDNLRHMLGVSERCPRGFRNYFVAGRANVASMERLRLAGFVTKSESFPVSVDPCYHATSEGARAVGLRRLP